MCGIVGYVGDQDAVSVLIDSLKRLEYRGYDSSGIATVSASGGASKLDVLKSIGYISNLEKKAVSKGANIGISHTRWATHGPPNEANAHPHTDCDGSIAVVHNGIIDNHLSLKQELMEGKHTFRSDTDSEVIPHLIEEEYRKSGGDLFEAVRLAVGRLKGSFAVVILHRDHPDRIICARRLSPMVLGRAVHQGYVASDVTALLKHTNRFLYMEDGEIAEVTADEIRVENMEGGVVKRDWVSVDWSVEDAEKGGFEHYMIKEIFEQPRSLHQTLTGWRSERADLPRNLVTARSIKIVACGTSYHAGLLGKYLFERFTGLPTQVEMASEYRYADPTSDDPLVILITQSGETADTTAAAREARRRGMRTISVTNVVGSSITRETDIPIYLRSGPEIGVAASKTFTSQLMIMYLLSSHIGFNMGRLNSEEYDSIHNGLTQTIRSIEGILKDIDPIVSQAEWFSDSSDAFFLGRYVNYPTSLEGALKMKEISYIHCEGFPAGELKHGPLALLTDKTPIVALVAADHSYEKMLGNIGECSARGSPVLAVVPEGDTEVTKYTDRMLTYPKLDPVFSPIPMSVILQILAYHTARIRGCSIDKPRNLAKSVTVE